MEFAVYRIRYLGDRKMGTFVNMFPGEEEAEAHARNLEGEHEVVGLWTREIPEEDSGLWATVVFLEDGTVEPGGAAETEREE